MERAAGTFQDRLVTELHLADARTMDQATAVLQDFLPRYNARFAVQPEHPEPAYRPADPDLCLPEIHKIAGEKVAASNASNPWTRTPTQLARWKAIQKGRLKGLSLRAISRELGISRVTVRKYAYAEKPPTKKLSAKEHAKLMALRKSEEISLLRFWGSWTVDRSTD